MRDFANLLKADVALEERMLKMIQRELRTLPGGRLKLGRRGTAVYYKPENAGPKEKARCLPPGSRFCSGSAPSISWWKPVPVRRSNPGARTYWRKPCTRKR